MRIWVLFCVFLIVSHCFGQTKIKCKSGIEIELDQNGEFLGHNKSAIIEKYAPNDSTWTATFSELLEQEISNRLLHYQNTKNIGLLEFKMKGNKAEEKNIQNNIKLLKKEITLLNKKYDVISNHIKNLKNIKPKQKPIESPKTASEVPMDSNIVVVKDIIVDSVIIAIEEERPAKKKTPEKPIEEIKPNKKAKTKSNCQYEFNGKKEGNRQIITQPETILTFTSDKLRNYFKLDDYLKIDMSLEQYDGDLFINAVLRFQSKDIIKSYGDLVASDFMRIDMISGRQVFFEIIDREKPYIEQYSANTIYKAKFKLMDKENLSILENDFVDKIGVLWSSGYEAYPVYKVDFIQQKIECLRMAK